MKESMATLRHIFDMLYFYLRLYMMTFYVFREKI